MGSVSPGARAGRADRDRAVDLVNEAYARAELTSAEREERVARALRAGRLAELRELTGDLQQTRSADFDEPDTGPDPTSPGRGRHARARIVLTTVALTLVAIVGLVVVLGVATSRSPGGASSRTEQMITRAQIEGFIAAYGQEFDTTETFSVQVFPRYVRVEVPVEQGTTRFDEEFYSEGEFSHNRSGSAVAGAEPVDLSRVDVAALLENVEREAEALGPDQDPDQTVVTVTSNTNWAASALRRDASSENVPARTQVEITVRTVYDEYRILVTDPAGRRIALLDQDGEWTMGTTGS